MINQKAFANGLGIPMGAVVNLLPSEEGEDIARLEQEPVCCHRCGAFVNPFCTVVCLDTGSFVILRLD